MKKRTVLFFTDAFPYGNGETFIETEMIEWEKRDDTSIVILPLLARSTNNRRDIPENAQIDFRLAKTLFKFEKWIPFLFPVIFLNPFFWKEIFNYPKVLLKPKQLRRLVAVSVFSKVIYWFLKKHYKNVLCENTVFYSYWFYYAAYGGALLKRKGFKFKQITRAHGTDVFQNRKDTACYIPFRRFPVWRYIDCIYPVSKNGTDYLHTNQHIPSNKLQVSYLGINKQNFICQASQEGTLNLVSCSNLIALKRVDLIISAIARYARQNGGIQINWYHIGDGPLRADLESLAKKELKSENVNFSFLGNLKNNEVIQFYENTQLDGFITTSESEGLPVSIMEAIMVGLPVVATNVGGINEAVNSDNGFLLPANFQQTDFEQGLDKLKYFKDLEQRKNIANKAKQEFHAKKNYNTFIDSI